MNREFDERIFWCIKEGGEIAPYQLPPVGTDLPKGAKELPLMYPVMKAMHRFGTTHIVRAVCVRPKCGRDYEVYLKSIVEHFIRPSSPYFKEFEEDFAECLRNAFINYAALDYLSYTAVNVAVKELQTLVGNRNYNKKRVKLLLKILSG